MSKIWFVDRYMHKNFVQTFQRVWLMDLKEFPTLNMLRRTFGCFGVDCRGAVSVVIAMAVSSDLP